MSKKHNGKNTILTCLAFLIFILLNLNNTCFALTFKDIQEKIQKKDICQINYNPSKSAAIVNIDCGSAIYINFKTRQTHAIIHHWPNIFPEWLTDNIATITGPCGTGCSQSIIFMAPSTQISCPVHEYRIKNLSQNEPPDFYNNNPLLIDPHKQIYACYNKQNSIQIFRMPKQLQTTIQPPRGYFSEQAFLRHKRLIIVYKNKNGKIKKISYPLKN